MAEATEILEKLEQLRTELVELAYTLDIRGRLDAADVAMTTSARIGELREAFAGGRPEHASARARLRRLRTAGSK